MVENNRKFIVQMPTDETKVINHKLFVKTEKLDGSNTVITRFDDKVINNIINILRKMENINENYQDIIGFLIHLDVDISFLNKENLRDFLCNFRYNGEPKYLVTSKKYILHPGQTNKDSFRKFLDLYNSKSIEFEKYSDLTIYLEWLPRPFIIKYDDDRYRKYYVIGIVNNGKWLTREGVKEITDKLQLETVPIIKEKELDKGKSEGFVYILNKETRVSTINTLTSMDNNIPLCVKIIFGRTNKKKGKSNINTEFNTIVHDYLNYGDINLDVILNTPYEKFDELPFDIKKIITVILNNQNSKTRYNMLINVHKKFHI